MVKNAENCLFCDSARHTTINCKSNMKGTLNKLISIMQNSECPNFGSFTLKELKFIAFTTPYKKSMYGSYGMRSNKLNREYERDPIPMTLSKTRMVKALQERWGSLGSVREKYNNKSTEPDDCPICFESIQTCSWSWKYSKWSLDYIPKTVRTTCNHHFCGNCWDNIKPVANNYRDSTKSCPLCRKHNTNTDILVCLNK